MDSTNTTIRLRPPTRVGQHCVRCVMDQSDPDIRFDGRGVCNHCEEYDRLAPKFCPDDVRAEAQLRSLEREIRERGRNRRYDCLIGLSGGVDSSYVAYLAHKLGLRVLAVHFDNGWNRETAVRNIQLLVDRFGFDLETYVIDWPEFRDLQRAFFRASVVDIEMVTDHAILAAMVLLARRYRIPTILSGNNFATEHGLPKAWRWRKTDRAQILDIHRRYGERRLRSYPTITTLRWELITSFGVPVRYFEPLNLIRYRKTQAIRTLEQQIGFRYYGGKHYESIFTKFYQAYILREKFGIDKRRAHFSALIRNGEMSRDAALAELEVQPYTPDELERDRVYVLKKLGFTEAEFDALMKEPPRPHGDFRSDDWLYRIMRRVYKWWSKPC